MQKKKLIMFTLDKITRDVNLRELQDFFEDYIDVESYTIYDDIPLKSLEANLILTVSSIPSYKIQRFMKKDTEILNGNRTILYDSYQKIRALPEGTRALVISTNKFTTLDLTYFLMRIEVSNVKLIPVYKEMKEVPKGDIAIVPLALDTDINIGDTKILDLNTRRITPETYQAIIWTLNISSANFDDKLYELSKLLVNTDLVDASLSKISTLGSILSNTLHAIDDGVIVISNNNHIIYSNKSFFKMLEYKNDLPEFLNEDILPEEIQKQIINGNELEDYIFHSEKLNKYFVINTKNINIKMNSSGCMVVLKEISNIQTLEKKIRGIVYKKGNIAKYKFDDMICESDIMKLVISKAKKIATIDRPTFITGDSGTGKEVLAQSIHNYSWRKNGPFVAVNCAAFSSELLESELFGYEEGSFTGAKKGGKIGLFELTHGGTLFLDEIGDMPLNMQTKLLRVLQENEVRRIGGENTIPVNVRVISATNKNLKELVEIGQFRLDLYYRLKVFTINIPSLRNRKKDIPPLINDRLKKISEFEGKPKSKSVGEELMKVLVNHTWPGNIRELINCAEYMYAMGSDVLNIEDLPPDFNENTIFLNNIDSDPIVESDFLSSFTRDEKEVVYEILKIISCQDVGRRKMIHLLKERDFEISEYKLRKFLAILKEKSIIDYDKNRKCNILSSEGRLLLEKC